MVFSQIKKTSVAEFPYRIEQEIKKKIDKFLFRETKRQGDGSLKSFKKTTIIEFMKIFSKTKSQLISSADNIVHHHFNIFSISKNYGNSINWHLDSKTNNSWPLKFWDDIDYRDGETIGGIKFA